ncbi:hypothetical protein NLG97_g4582 [Lecanicillium saksenae]|uniref:Uncharacterized protein n=1 Tax=Lecanicillium saksenae TaxID=468837 RepID=A0ACC1QUV6_9HYPO|nr:hypothetical protein NLG97_g4582 [Lecanicillium saksenae]
MSSSGQMASSTESSTHSAPTGTLLPQITPFVAPAGCEGGGAFLTTTGEHDNGGTFIVSDPSHLPTCQPSGWNSGATRFQYSPAVCPRGWTAYSLSVSQSAGVKFESQAACCSKGFSYVEYYYNPLSSSRAPACFRTTGTGKPGQGVVTVHDPWQIRWQGSDVTSLSPTPPSMDIKCNNVQVTSWVPGSKVDPKARATCGFPTAQIEEGVPYFGPAQLWIWLPILIVVLIGFGLCFGCYRRSKWKREDAAQLEAERAARRMAREAEEGKPTTCNEF